ncbi:MAG TPA: hypothetical protein VK348_06380, partial [Planctomycetota bacterium]|nr:hypothetical protein [Planctomycetota bacterium]
QLSSTDLEWGAQRAADELRAYDATIVYLPWRLEGHPDHHALHVAVMRGLERSGSTARAYGYEVWQAMVPDLIVDITPVIAAKQRAMACYHSQLAYVRFDHCTLGLNAHRSLIHARGQGYGEAFQRLR